jgi:hypothetical protein
MSDVISSMGLIQYNLSSDHTDESCETTLVAYVEDGGVIFTIQTLADYLTVSQQRGVLDNYIGQKHPCSTVRYVRCKC